jgi:hypothetical protein
MSKCIKKICPLETKNLEQKHVFIFKD